MMLGYKILDAAFTVLAFSMAYIITFFLTPFDVVSLSASEFLLVLPIVVSASWLVFEWLAIISEYARPVFNLQAASDDIELTTGIIIFIVFFVWFFNIPNFGRLLALLFFIISIILRIIVRTIARKTGLVWINRPHSKVQNLLIVGSKTRAQDFIDLVSERNTGDYRIIGCLEVDEDCPHTEVAKGVKVIGSIGDLEEILKNKVVDEVIFAMPFNKIPDAHYYMVLAEEIGTLVRIIPDWQIHSLSYTPRIASLVIEPFMGIPTMALVTTFRRSLALMTKEATGYAIALFVVLLLFPVFICIAVAIKMKSPGPVIFKQERIGLHGRRFNMFKFRTMSPNAEALKDQIDDMNEADGPVFKIQDDPRIIPGIGHFLRRTSLDELPQFFNVLAGQMSIVGPRPPIQGEVVRYKVPQLRRLSVKPGITCLWQCMPARNKVTFEKWVEKDLEYIDGWSLWLDLKILLRTLWVVLGRQGQ